ncbi:3-hydroxyacyl-CoA dehydrogenase family protein [Tsukamurella tyrosinosolvens]|uniref:3-hydroxyacyl-CoA dehydrogenase family protein n=1 Tax=Tsukamurella tyrosinosolvens TaxID=57704 RepID=UPI0007973766|nr:3-hydroxyacyl-CoA dehydrogenase family protein [Tsukamurella tyrosinosolvens]KXP05347.1 3-hydroxybutyryl-CoA dehydrogenase [Tsukamurella tyrosinosolvens]KZL94749.1 3-hydroxybutyryl-CoA dehydrogenase [Tsukamurella tyrosinosolvens]MCA4994105.1 3-hydroxyacyl-CoA dehydrogenase family protein [Tsukamurella tyrosinosolvens]MEC4614642.1 3-hydroxyacyl-CoA dehydrogenase family protein [Tsukamurella tyrosinosolvens]
MSTAPSTVGVVGGGRMGAGIAQVFATLGATVVLAESGDREAARERVINGLQRAAERDKLGGRTPDEVAARLTVVADIEDLPTAADVVIEAVPEVVDLKLDVLHRVEGTVGPQCVIASNTSSLSIAVLAAALDAPHRLVGMHFFNPVPASTLVEIIRTPDTDDAVVDRVRGWVELLGKQEVLVNDSPGFATSRLGVCLGLEAIRMLEEGVADAESIDRAMELGYRHPMGPLRSTDLVGLDVRLAIAEHLASTLGERFAPPQLLRDKVANGELGRKTGRGFHTWS